MMSNKDLATWLNTSGMLLQILEEFNDENFQCENYPSYPCEYYPPPLYPKHRYIKHNILIEKESN